MKERNGKKLFVLFYPWLAKALGSIQAAIYYQHLWFWRNKGGRRDGFIYKSKSEIERETALTRNQQDRVRERLEIGGFLEVKKKMANGHPTLHFKPLISPTSISEKATNPQARNQPIHEHDNSFSITDKNPEKETDNRLPDGNSPISLSKKKTYQTETYLRNKALLEQQILIGEYGKPEYLLSDNDPYGWRYIYADLKRLTPERAVIAIYWREKEKYTKLQETWDFNYSFSTKDLADAAIKVNSHPARQLASCVGLEDISKLIEIADGKAWNEERQMYSWEWKLGTLLKYLDKLPSA